MKIGTLRHLVTLENPGPAVPDGGGGFTQSWVALAPAQVWASIAPATARDLEQVTAGTVMSTATHVLHMRYHPELTTQTRITFETRTFQVSGVANLEERNIELVVLCTETVT